MTAPIIIDIALVAILITAVYLGAARGLMKAVAGLGGTILGFAGAFALCNRFAPMTAKWIEPFVRGIVRKTAESAGLTDILNSPLVTETKEGFQSLMAALHLTDPNLAGNVADSAANAGEKIITTASSSLSAQLAPILTFVLLLVVIKLIVSIVAKLFSMNIPVVRTINKGAGALLGALSGIVIVVVLCFGVLKFAPEANVGVINQAALRESVVGGFVAQMLE